MKKPRARYRIVEETRVRIVLEDASPRDERLNVTSAPQGVIDELIAGGRLTPGRRVYYRSPTWGLAEIHIEAGCFAGFILDRPAPEQS